MPFNKLNRNLELYKLMNNIGNIYGVGILTNRTALLNKNP
jgi:hypothetical protein